MHKHLYKLQRMLESRESCEWNLNCSFAPQISSIEEQWCNILLAALCKGYLQSTEAFWWVAHQNACKELIWMTKWSHLWTFYTFIPCFCLFYHLRHVFFLSDLEQILKTSPIAHLIFWLSAVFFLFCTCPCLLLHLQSQSICRWRRPGISGWLFTVQRWKWSRFL